MLRTSGDCVTRLPASRGMCETPPKQSSGYPGRDHTAQDTLFNPGRSLVTEPDAPMEHAAENIVDAWVCRRIGVVAGAVAHDLGWRRIERIIHRRIKLNILVPPIGRA